MLYLHLGTALHSESCEPMEVYRTLYDNDMAPVWARPQAMFHEELSSGVKRFTEVARVRICMPEDEARFLAFGYDAWGAGLSLEEFIAAYGKNKSHLRGIRYVVESFDGEPIGNLNTLRIARGFIGLESLSINPLLRGRGYGSMLMRAVMELVRCEDPDARFVIQAEADSFFYERLGFRRIADQYQFRLPSVVMITGEQPIPEDKILLLREYF